MVPLLPDLLLVSGKAHSVFAYVVYDRQHCVGCGGSGNIRVVYNYGEPSTGTAQGHVTSGETMGKQSQMPSTISYRARCRTLLGYLQNALLQPLFLVLCTPWLSLLAGGGVFRRTRYSGGIGDRSLCGDLFHIRKCAAKDLAGSVEKKRRLATFVARSAADHF